MHIKITIILILLLTPELECNSSNARNKKLSIKRRTHVPFKCE
jgi:hypothetical protein